MSKDDDKQWEALNYLESERKKIWERLVQLQGDIDKKTSDYESEARQASKKCSEYRNRCEETKEEAGRYLVEIKNSKDDVEKKKGEVLELFNQTKAKESAIDELHQQITAVHDDISNRKDTLEEQIGELESLFEKHASFTEKINSLTNLYTQSEDYASKLKVSYNQLVSRKNEIDQLYYEIIGFTETDSETNEETEVPGLKGELEVAFTELKTGFAEFEKSTKQEVAETIKGWNAEYDSVIARIRSLLPNALTTGLSYAYTQKKEDEIRESGTLQKVFQRAIVGLVCVSLIPFLVSIYLIVVGTSLDETILKLPRLALAILPLYIPILWVAYSANRKLNLSKRLIEEYTHKEVLSKTFEGLSTQLESLEDSPASEELRTKLLFNILEVSSENPGKLISNYDKSDHPLMDALDKSVQLSNAISRLAKIPGMSKLVTALERKSDRMLNEEAKKAEEGIVVAQTKTA